MSTPDDNGLDQRPESLRKVPPFLRWLLLLHLIVFSLAITQAVFLPLPEASPGKPEVRAIVSDLIVMLIMMLRVMSLWLAVWAGDYLVRFQEHPTRKNFWSPV